MLRFEYDNAKNCAQALLDLGPINMKMWYLFEWLTLHDELRHGTQAEVVKLYVDEELVAYSLFESYEACLDKKRIFQQDIYQDLGVVHFVTLPTHRKKGYASLLADVIYNQVIKPLLARHSEVHAYIVATERAVPLMQRTAIKPSQLVTQFYSDITFTDKVVKQINPTFKSEQ
jgi:GNAT superfamily N-acetyltransferase